MIFNNILGNEKALSFLNNTITSNNVSHSYMFVGNSGIGKFLCSQVYSKAILCEKNDNCGICNSCISIHNSKHSDFAIIDIEER